jgi:hypothetical protein
MGKWCPFITPFSWHLLSFNFFWPESLPTYIITAFGFVYFILTYKKATGEYSDLVLPDLKRTLLSVTLLLLYFIIPLFILNLPEQHNNHFVKTLRDYETRTGKYFELDRARYIPEVNGNFIKTFANEKIKAANLKLENEHLISIKGKFISPDEMYIEDYHIHTKFRDDTSLIGISLTAILWLNCIYLAGKQRKDDLSATTLKSS